MESKILEPIWILDFRRSQTFKYSLFLGWFFMKF